MKRTGYLASFIALSLLCACATQPPVNETVETGRVAVADAIGLTRSQLEERLGLAPTPEPRVGFAELRDGVVVSEMFAGFLALPHRCPGGAIPQLHSPPVTYFVFHDDVLASLQSRPMPARMTSEEIGQADVFVTCTRRSLTQKQISDNVAAVIVLAPMLLPVAGAMAVVNGLGSNNINTPLSHMRLGAAPPGGLDAYIADLPRSARLLKRSGRDAEIGFYFVSPDTAEEAARTDAARVFITDGIVTRLQGRNCVLAADRFFRCSTRY